MYMVAFIDIKLVIVGYIRQIINLTLFTIAANRSAGIPAHSLNVCEANVAMCV